MEREGKTEGRQKVGRKLEGKGERRRKEEGIKEGERKEWKEEERTEESGREREKEGPIVLTTAMCRLRSSLHMLSAQVLLALPQYRGTEDQLGSPTAVS